MNGTKKIRGQTRSKEVKKIESDKKVENHKKIKEQ